jgi:NodT family efflux transporter outer membrane factor (OMF) lipoprotein
MTTGKVEAKRLRRRMTAAAFVFAVVGLAAGGCVKVGPDYQKPASPTPAEFKGATSTDPGAPTFKTAAVDPAWWRGLGDPTLTGLVEASVRHNQQLAVAVANANEARAMRRAAGLNDDPKVSVGGYQRTVRADQSDTVAANSTRGDVWKVFSLGFDAAWEPDLFGRASREAEAADARFLAAEAAVDAARLTVAAETARNYVELRADQRRIAVTQNEINLRRQLVGTIRERRNAGLALDFDLAGAEAELRRVEAQVPTYRARIHAAAQRIAVLAGGEAGGLVERLSAPSSVPAAPDVVPVGLPSDLLLRRPDLRRAERVLHAATAEVGVATADLFPRFSLTGGFGTRAGSFTELFAAGGWYFGPSLKIPLFNRERLRALADAAGARAEAAAAEYRQAALTALSEVEIALVDYAQEQLRRRDLQKAVERSRSALGQARDLYSRGLKDIVTVIVAQRSLADNEEALITGEAGAMTKLIVLYKALGGGWGDERAGA